MDYVEEKKHPSYGMIGISRTSGSGGKRRLFGSILKEHFTTFRIQIVPGQERLDDNGEWHYSRSHGNDDYIEIELSAIQFSELITTMNVCSGVPCTITYVNGKRVEGPPVLETDPHAQANKTLKEEMKKAVSDLRKHYIKVKEVLEKKSLNKGDRDFILNGMSRFVGEFENNVPFLATIYKEALEKMATSAKAEIDSFVTHNVVLRGMQAFGFGLPQEETVQQLGEGDVQEAKDS